MSGVTIGDNVLVAAMDVVQEWLWGGGNPAKIICSVEEYYEKIRNTIYMQKVCRTMKKEILEWSFR